MNTVDNLQDIDTSSEQIQYKEDYLSNELIQGTPLWLTKKNEDGTEWVLSFGKYALRNGKSKEELKNYLENNLLNVITNIAICIVEEFKNFNNEKKDDSL